MDTSRVKLGAGLDESNFTDSLSVIQGSPNLIGPSAKAQRSNIQTHFYSESFNLFFLTHNRGGPSPQGGLIEENEVQY